MLDAFEMSFKPLFRAIEYEKCFTGESGIYLINTHGKTMFQKNSPGNHFDSLVRKDEMGSRKQANSLHIAFDSTMLFKAVALANIVKDHVKILQTQNEMMNSLDININCSMAHYLNDSLNYSLNVLNHILDKYVYNYDNLICKNHSEIRRIKTDAESIIKSIYEQIISRVNETSLLTVNHDLIKQFEEEVPELFNFDLTALYILAFSSYLDVMFVMLVGNPDKAHLEEMSCELERYSYTYRERRELYNLIVTKSHHAFIFLVLASC